MSDSHDNASMESQTLPGWTLVNNQGEILSGDEDSESSESSIEVVSLENNEIVSHRLQRERSSEQVEVVVTDAAPSTDSVSDEINSSIEDVAKVEKAEFSSVSDETVQNSLDLQEVILDSDIIHETKTEISVPDPVHTDFTLSRSSDSQEKTSTSPDGVNQEQEVDVLGDNSTMQCSRESLSTVACEMPPDSGENDFCQAQVGENDETVAGTNIFEVNTEICKAPFNVDDDVDLHQIACFLGLEEPRREVSDKANSGACCMELLLEGGGDSQHTHSFVSADAKGQPSPVSFEEADISQVSGESTTECNHSSRNDSDADSDFVRLDPENIDAYDGEHQNEERVAIPLRLYRTGSSIGPSFSFMRSDERENQVPQNDDSVVDQDRDDDTESSTEEGIDDRIESEQSEAGSLSAQNDVGDLSVFADIGDLPLVTGNVPRNYIHRPNNHLSTVLNIIVVLVAILTMGISLGIIMATDLEIEEWQTAHEFQTRRASQLEILLKSKTNAYELQMNRVKELEPQLIEMKNNLRTLEKRAKNYERAFDTFAAYSSLEGGSFDEVLHTVLDGIRDYAHCQEESNQLVAVDCHLKLLPYVKSYTTLIKNDMSVDKAINMNEEVSLEKKAYDNVDVRMSSHDITADAPSLPVSNGIDDDSQGPQKEELGHVPSTAYIAGTETENLDLVSVSDEVISEEKSDTLPLSSESGDISEDNTLSSSSELLYHTKDKTAALLATPVTLDIRQLQQSLTLEMERALHWQQLYLSERRQRERERENEEWEDEREREMAEREREQVDHVECLRKLMSANLTTLTQHVVKWNVSVFDDFANLSVLLSGIAELQQAVIDSVQRVWKSAEEVIDSLQNKDSTIEEETREHPVPKKEMIIEYLGQLVEQVKRVDMPDHDVLVEYVGRMLDHVKHGAEDILNEVYTESVTNSVYKMWENAEELIKGYQSHKETAIGAENIDSTLPEREHLLVYLSKALNDICHKDNTAFETHSVEVNDKVEHGKQGPGVFLPHEDKASEYRDYSRISPSGPHLETLPHGPHLLDEEPSKHGFWSRKIGKMLKKTGKTVRKLGRKVACTWDKVKTIWREKIPLWHKIKNIWHDKKSVFFKTGDRFASTVKKASSKFARMCTKMSTGWFKTTETAEVDIHTKCVHKIRKHWQKMVVNDPCQIVGKFSYECNSGRKQCKRDLHKISDSLSHLMKVPNFRSNQILKLNTNDFKEYQKQFQSFLGQWGKSKLLLRSDIRWVECQLAWWSTAATASKHGNLGELQDNKCNIINLSDNLYEGHHAIIFGPDISCLVEHPDKVADKIHNEKHDSGDYDHIRSQQSSFVASVQDENANQHDDGEENDHEDEDGHEHSILNSDETEVNETALGYKDSSDWYHEQSKHRKHLRSGKKKASWVFEQAANRKQERNKRQTDVTKDDRNEAHLGNWIFENAKNREQQREDSSKSFWLFERASHRRDSFRQKFMDPGNELKYSEHQYHKKGAKKSGDWFMKHAEERQKIRENEHKSDWLFERAAERRMLHEGRHNSNSRKHNSHKPEHGKQFRHTYGKVSTP